MALFGLLVGTAQANVGEARALPPDELVIGVPVERGTSFGQIAAQYDLSERTLRDAAKGVHDLARIRPDRELQLAFVDGDAAAVGLRYQLDSERTLVLAREGVDWTVEIEALAWESRWVTVNLSVEGSLWQTLAEAGLDPTDLSRVEKVFQYVIDLNTEVHRGDRLSLVVEMREAPGRRARLGQVAAARYEGKSKDVTAVHFPDEEGKSAWYQPDGTSLVKAFLRSPLAFSAVTSGFNPRRYHPILKTRRPHNGTDFGAPTGTSVRSVADGVVISAGYAGGHGNYVEVQHDGVWKTSYSHLSRISVRRGQRVGQGDRIGSVGSTGLATGPHLHFQMWKNGRFVDPMRIDLPLQRNLPEHRKAEFAAEVNRWTALLPAEDAPRGVLALTLEVAPAPEATAAAP